jgi:hypothetical protein
MNWIRKTIIFIGLSIAFLFALSANKAVVSEIPSEKTESSFTIDGIHSSVFIQPQASSTFTAPNKTLDFSVLKYFENLLVVIPDLKIGKFLTAFAKQDINRCEMVSLLLFPFHYFW